MKAESQFSEMMKDASRNSYYIKCLGMPVCETAFLLEAGQGKNINGNVFALLRCIRSQAGFDGYDIYLSVMPEMKEKAAARCRHYGLENVTIVVNGSDEYKKALACSKYLITDNSFTPYFIKRREQVYLNTWHGTPLKALGRTDLRNAASLATVQANMLKADWLLHPNHFTRDIMMKDYMVGRLFGNKTVILDYPRNDALYRQEFKKEISEKYGLEGRKLIAYMPTWRGSGRTADIEEQIAQTERIIGDISSSLNEGEMLCVNLHFLLGSSIDVSGYDNVMMFPPEYETYDFLALCDTLITDYSSVSVDFAGTGRDIILYIYDYEQYKEDKGFYFDVKDLPFKLAENAEELRECLRSGRKEYSLDEQFVCDDRGHSSEKLLDLIVNGREDGLETEDWSSPTDTELVYFGNIRREENLRLLREYTERLSEEEKLRTVIAFESPVNDETADILESLGSSIDFIRIHRYQYKNRHDYLATALFKRSGIMRAAADAFYEREADRMLRPMNIAVLKLVMFQLADRAFILSKAPAETIMYELPAGMYPASCRKLLKDPKMGRVLRNSFDKCVSFDSML